MRFIEKLELLIIDPQNDFCSPKGSLFVPGADKDSVRLSTMIDRLRKRMDDIHVTLCPHCSGNARKTIEFMHELAESRGGKCLSDEYINSRTHMEFQCSEGHQFLTVASDAIRGQWCPKCKVRINERIVKGYFDNIFNSVFEKCRPKWLKNERGNQMELDGYNKELGMAFEYHGEQHYKITYYMNEEQLKQRMKDDEWRRKVCMDNGIILIEIPYWIERENIGKYIYSEYKKEKTKLSISYKNINKINYKDFNIYDSKRLKVFQDYATMKGGKCLSQVYVDSITHLKMECAKGYVFAPLPHSLLRGSWCPICVRKK